MLMMKTSACSIEYFVPSSVAVLDQYVTRSYDPSSPPLTPRDCVSPLSRGRRQQVLSAARGLSSPKALFTSSESPLHHRLSSSPLRPLPMLAEGRHARPFSAWSPRRRPPPEGFQYGASHQRPSYGIDMSARSRPTTPRGPHTPRQHASSATPRAPPTPRAAAHDSFRRSFPSPYSAAPYLADSA